MWANGSHRRDLQQGPHRQHLLHLNVQYLAHALIQSNLKWQQNIFLSNEGLRALLRGPTVATCYLVMRLEPTSPGRQTGRMYRTHLALMIRCCSERLFSGLSFGLSRSSGPSPHSPPCCLVHSPTLTVSPPLHALCKLAFLRDMWMILEEMEYLRTVMIVLSVGR